MREKYPSVFSMYDLKLMILMLKTARWCRCLIWQKSPYIYKILIKFGMQFESGHYLTYWLKRLDCTNKPGPMFNRKRLCLIFCNHSLLFVEIWFASYHEWWYWICIVLLWLTFYQKHFRTNRENSASSSIRYHFFYITSYHILPINLFIQCGRFWKDFRSEISKQNTTPIASLKNISPRDSNLLFPAVSLVIQNDT